MAPTVQTPGHSPGCGSSLWLPLPPLSSPPGQPWASGLLSSFFGGAALCGNCDLSSHTRGGARAPALEAPGLDYPTPREVPDILLIDVSHPFTHGFPFPIPQSGPASSPSYLANAHCTHLAASPTRISVLQSHPAPSPISAISSTSLSSTSALCQHLPILRISGVSSPGAQEQRTHLPVQMWVRSRGGEDPLEEEIATHTPVFLAEEFHRGAWQVTVHGVRVRRD